MRGFYTGDDGQVRAHLPSDVGCLAQPFAQRLDRAGADVIAGVAGNDWLNGGAGDDTVTGDTNAAGDLTSFDRIFGGAGNDRIEVGVLTGQYPSGSLTTINLDIDAGAGDDHACKSSTLPHQSEHAFDAAM